MKGKGWAGETHPVFVNDALDLAQDEVAAVHPSDPGPRFLNVSRPPCNAREPIWTYRLIVCATTRPWDDTGPLSWNLVCDVRSVKS